MATSAQDEVVREVVRDEAQRAEFGASIVRGVCLTCLAVTTFLIAPTDSLLQQAPAIPRLINAFSVLSWGIVLLARRSAFRSAVSYLSVGFDLTVTFTIMALVGFQAGTLGPTALMIGGTPLLPLLFFLVVAAGVRQSPRLTLVTTVMVVIANAGVLALLRSRIPKALYESELGGALAPQLWVVRSLILIFTGAVAAFGAWTGRRMAMRAGRLSADRSAVISLFGRYVDPQVASVVMASQNNSAELREVTVVFTDLRGFTSLAERVPPGELLGLLNAHYGAIVPCVHRHGGTVNKFVGDSIMAVFGAPIPQADHARRALLASADMIEAMRVLNEQLAARGAPLLAMGVGVASGSVVVGRLGAADRVEYAVIGDAVNTAARLEGLTKEHGAPLLASGSTVAAASSVLPLVPIGDVTVRGKALPVSVFALRPGPVAVAS